MLDVLYPRPFAWHGLCRAGRSRYYVAMTEEQFGFDLGEAARPTGVYFDPDDIRADARELIAEAQAATADAHWDEETLHYHRIAFPHLVSWLPDEDERAQLRFEFTGALERIEQLLAA